MITLRRRLLTVMAMTTLAFVAPGQPEAAVEGQAGAVSKATLELAVVLNESMNASGFGELDLGDDGLTPGMGSTNGCILSASGSYTVRAVSSHGDGFAAVDATGDTARYRVRWSDAQGAHSDLQPGDVSEQFSAEVADLARCRQVGNARIEVALDDPSRAEGGYHDVLTLIVAPQ